MATGKEASLAKISLNMTRKPAVADQLAGRLTRVGQLLQEGGKNADVLVTVAADDCRLGNRNAATRTGNRINFRRLRCGYKRYRRVS